MEDDPILMGFFFLRAYPFMDFGVIWDRKQDFFI